MIPIRFAIPGYLADVDPDPDVALSDHAPDLGRDLTENAEIISQPPPADIPPNRWHRAEYRFQA